MPGFLPESIHHKEVGWQIDTRASINPLVLNCRNPTSYGEPAQPPSTLAEAASATPGRCTASIGSTLAPTRPLHLKLDLAGNLPGVNLERSAITDQNG